MTGSSSDFVRKTSDLLGVHEKLFYVAWGTQTPAQGEDQADPAGVALRGHGSRSCRGGLVLKGENTTLEVLRNERLSCIQEQVVNTSQNSPTAGLNFRSQTTGLLH